MNIGKLTNHLGNVMEVITDRKLPQADAYVLEDFESGNITMSNSTNIPGTWFFDNYSNTPGAGVTSYAIQNHAGSNQMLVQAGAAFFGAHRSFTVEPSTVYTFSFDLENVNTTNIGIQIREGLPGQTTLLNAGGYADGHIIIVCTTTVNASVLRFKIMNSGIAGSQGSFYIDNFSVTGEGLRENETVFYTPDVISYSDYYPFHLQMPGRNGGGDYRYTGANGQETQPEITGNNSHSTAEYWMYDSRLGRRWNLDPVFYPSLSQFGTFQNNPIVFKDVNGDDVEVYGGRQTKKQIRWEKRNVAGFRATFRQQRNDPNNLHIYKTSDHVGSSRVGNAFQVSTQTNNHVGPSNAFNFDDPTTAGDNVGSSEHPSTLNTIFHVFIERENNSFSFTDPPKLRDQPLKGTWSVDTEFKMDLINSGTLQINASLLAGYSISVLIDNVPQNGGRPVITNPQVLPLSGDPYDAEHPRVNFSNNLPYRLTSTNQIHKITIRLSTTLEGGLVHHLGYYMPANLVRGSVSLISNL